MYQSDITNSLLARQCLILQAQQLAARYPETGIKPDNLVILPLDDLVGTLAFLKRFHLEKAG